MKTAIWFKPIFELTEDELTRELRRVRGRLEAGHDFEEVHRICENDVWKIRRDLHDREAALLAEINRRERERREVVSG